MTTLPSKSNETHVGNIDQSKSFFANFLIDILRDTSKHIFKMLRMHAGRHALLRKLECAQIQGDLSQKLKNKKKEMIQYLHSSKTIISNFKSCSMFTLFTTRPQIHFNIDHAHTCTDLHRKFTILDINNKSPRL